MLQGLGPLHDRQPATSLVHLVYAPRGLSSLELLSHQVSDEYINKLLINKLMLL